MQVRGVACCCGAETGHLWATSRAANSKALVLQPRVSLLWQCRFVFFGPCCALSLPMQHCILQPCFGVPHTDIDPSFIPRSLHVCILPALGQASTTQVGARLPQNQ